MTRALRNLAESRFANRAVFKVSPNQISQWKQEAIRNMEKAFGGKGDEKSEDDEKSIRKLREKVGELTIERDFFEDACKRLGLT